MGKKTRMKMEKAANDELAWGAFFLKDNLKRKQVTQERESKNTDLMIFNQVFAQYTSKSIEGFKSNTHNIDRRRADMAKFLFAKYRVPSILANVWDENRAESNNARNLNHQPADITRTLRNRPQTAIFREWYINIVSGGSFHKECTKDFLTRKEAHTFVNTRHPIDPLAALIYSIAKNAGAKDGDALRIARCKISLLHIMGENDVWRDLIRFFAREVPATVNEANDIIDWVQSNVAQNQAWRISGHGFNLETIRRRVTDWHYALARLKNLGNASWSGHGVGNFQMELLDEYKMPEVWTITQILNTKELAAEGTAQHHCVYSYKERCASGSCSIWSMRSNNTRKVTIELRNDGTIVQARGYANRKMRPREAMVLETWTRQNDLYIQEYVF